MQDFFTWAMLATYAGAVLCTTVVTQMLKGVALIERLPTRVFSYLVAACVLLAATLFTGNMTPENGVLCLVNAAVVSLASNGAFEAVHKGGQA